MNSRPTSSASSASSWRSWGHCDRRRARSHERRALVHFSVEDAELVKIEPKAIGLSTTLAENVVTHRNTNGPFKKRRQILDVPRLGPKAFEQAAGFLRIMDGDDPLDRSAVHPEAYPVVERIAKATGRTVASLVGDAAFLRTVDPAKFTDERFGLPTVKDILAELEKPGRDPRPEFKTATFAEGVEDMKDLTPGMILEGVVTNVTNFGAFVDVGVHQDGLVHISQLSHTFVQDPNEVVAHRDWTRAVDVEVCVYADRLEVISPGGLPNSMSIQKMLAGQRSPRNPMIMDILRDYGYVDARGMGIRRKVVPLMRNQNAREPVFELTEDYLKTTLFRAPNP